MSWGIFGGIGIGLPPIMHFGLPGDVAKQDAVLKGCLSGDKVRGGICATDGGIRMTLPTAERILWHGGAHTTGPELGPCVARTTGPGIGASWGRLRRFRITNICGTWFPSQHRARQQRGGRCHSPCCLFILLEVKDNTVTR